MHVKKRSLLISTFGFIVLLATYSHPLFAQPGMMHDMDEHHMGQMMQERGYMGPGYGRGYPGRHMGPMMGDPMGGMGGPMMMGPMMMHLHGLNLSKEQMDKVQNIHRKARKEHFALMEKMMDQSDKLYDLYNVDKPNPEKVGKVYEEIHKIKREMILQHIKIRNEIYDLLSKEQKERFKQNDPFRRHFGMMR